MYEFQVPKLSCGHCVATVTRAIQSADPAARVQADLAAKTLRVESRAEEAALRQALAGVGYPAQ